MITYLELLKRIADKRQPRKVVYVDIEYEWHSYYESYTRDPDESEKNETDIVFLNEIITEDMGDMSLATMPVIEVDE